MRNTTAVGRRRERIPEFPSSDVKPHATILVSALLVLVLVGLLIGEGVGTLGVLVINTVLTHARPDA